jgi:hypothetical protein
MSSVCAGVALSLKTFFLKQCGTCLILLLSLSVVQGSSQIRQSFSKRKRGIAQKAYQLYKITDAKVRALLSVLAKSARAQ